MRPSNEEQWNVFGGHSIAVGGEEEVEGFDPLVFREEAIELADANSASTNILTTDESEYDANNPPGDRPRGIQDVNEVAVRLRREVRGRRRRRNRILLREGRKRRRIE